MNMSHRSCIITAALALVLAITLVSAKPSSTTLTLAVNKTVCRTVVEEDENENRIPRTIKIIKCASDPYEMCPAAEGQDVPCCGAYTKSSASQFRCTELQDSVVVMKTTNYELYTMSVPIGCYCTRHSVKNAAEYLK